MTLSRRVINLTVPLHILRGIGAIIGIAALVLIWGAVFDSTARNDTEAFDRAQSTAGERAQTTADAMQATIDRLDFTLLTVRHAGHSDGVQTGQSRLAVASLATQKARFVHINAQGYIIHSILSDFSYDSHDYVGNFDYFLRQKNSSDDALQIGAPFLERTASSSTWLLPLSRKIQGKDQFAGVVSLYMPLDAKQLWPSLASKNDFIAILFSDGQFVQRTPNPENVYGKRAPVDWPFLRSPTLAQGQFITRAANTAPRYLIAWCRLPNELIAIAGIALDDALASAQAMNRKIRITGSVLSTLTVLLTIGFIIALFRIEKFLHSHNERTALHFNLADSMTEGVMELDADNRIFRINPAFSEITGYPAEAVQNRAPDFLSPVHQDARNLGRLIDHWIRENGDAVSEGDFDGLRANNTTESFGGHTTFSFIGHAILTPRAGLNAHRIVLITNVTAERRKEEEIWRSANLDELTQLPNAALMQDHLQLMLHHASLHNCGVAVLFVDLDYFLPLTTPGGHEIADRLLYEVARRLRDLFHEENTVARLKEDQFIVLLPDYGTASVAERAAARVVGCFSDPFTVDESGVQINITCSVGLARLPVNGSTALELLQHAEQAVLRAKNKGRSNWST
jgi:diguanylate cyclase (GGDEF)-like protein